MTKNLHQWPFWKITARSFMIVNHQFHVFVVLFWTTTQLSINIGRAAVEYTKLHMSKYHCELLLSSKYQSFFFNRCDICPKRYYTKRLLEQHLINKHSSKAKLNKCKTCQKVFRWPSDLRDHELIHLPKEIKNTHPCPHCDMK